MDLKLGEMVPLKAQLAGGETNKFPQAVIRDASDTPIAGSPFTLTHVAGGLYTNNGVTMPNTAVISVQYKVFNDAGHTTQDEDYGVVSENYMLNTEVIAGELQAIVEDSTELRAVVDECDC